MNTIIIHVYQLNYTLRSEKNEKWHFSCAMFLAEQYIVIGRIMLNVLPADTLDFYTTFSFRSNG